MLMAAFNELMLAVEIYLAHSISGAIGFNTWQNLVAWVETSPYKFGENLCLEEHITFMDLVSDENLVLALYLPVE